MLVLDQNGRAVTFTPVSFSVNSKEVSWPDCKTDGFGKVVLTWPSDPAPYICSYSVGKPAQTGKISLPKGPLHNIRIELRNKAQLSVAIERKFRVVQRKTIHVRNPMDSGPLLDAEVEIYEAGGVPVSPSRVLDALMVDEKTGDVRAAFVDDDGKPFSIVATKWEKTHCLPLGKTRFVPVVTTTGFPVGWYQPLVSPEHLFTVVPHLFVELFPDLFPKADGVPPASITFYDPQGSAGNEWFLVLRERVGLPRRFRRSSIRCPVRY